MADRPPAYHSPHDSRIARIFGNSPGIYFLGPEILGERGIFNIFSAHLKTEGHLSHMLSHMLSRMSHAVSHAVSQQRKIPESIIFKPKIFPEYIFGLPETPLNWRRSILARSFNLITFGSSSTAILRTPIRPLKSRQHGATVDQRPAGVRQAANTGSSTAGERHTTCISLRQ
jgi:hypothetical protein